MAEINQKGRFETFEEAMDYATFFRKNTENNSVTVELVTMLDSYEVIIKRI